MTKLSRRKGRNTKYRGKKALRPILCFIDETREYLIGKLRKGQTASGEEAAAFIAKAGTVPSNVKALNPKLSGCRACRRYKENVFAL